MDSLCSLLVRNSQPAAEDRGIVVLYGREEEEFVHLAGAVDGKEEGGGEGREQLFF